MDGGRTDCARGRAVFAERGWPSSKSREPERGGLTWEERHGELAQAITKLLTGSCESRGACAPGAWENSRNKKRAPMV